MEICHHWKNERADAVVSGHNNEIAASARQQIDHLSDIALRDWPRCRYSIAKDARDALSFAKPLSAFFVVTFTE